MTPSLQNRTPTSMRWTSASAWKPLPIPITWMSAYDFKWAQNSTFSKFWKSTSDLHWRASSKFLKFWNSESDLNLTHVSNVFGLRILQSWGLSSGIFYRSTRRTESASKYVFTNEDPPEPLNIYVQSQLISFWIYKVFDHVHTLWGNYGPVTVHMSFKKHF